MCNQDNADHDIVFVCLSVATASTLNSILMRQHELREGIEVVDEKGEVVGTSKIAAKKVSVCVSTCISNDPLPCMLMNLTSFAMYLSGCHSNRHHKVLSPCSNTHHPSNCHGMARTVSIIHFITGILINGDYALHCVSTMHIHRREFMRKWPRVHLPIQVVVCTLCFGFALPVSIALFPQNTEVP